MRILVVEDERPLACSLALEPVSEGTCFRVELPVGSPDPEPLGSAPGSG